MRRTCAPSRITAFVRNLVRQAAERTRRCSRSSSRRATAGKTTSGFAAPANCRCLSPLRQPFSNATACLAPPPFDCCSASLRWASCEGQIDQDDSKAVSASESFGCTPRVAPTASGLRLLPMAPPVFQDIFVRSSVYADLSDPLSLLSRSSDPSPPLLLHRQPCLSLLSPLLCAGLPVFYSVFLYCSCNTPANLFHPFLPLPLDASCVPLSTLSLVCPALPLDSVF
eukprot:2496255-Pleurochrysis_carterae.AAC.2